MRRSATLLLIGSLVAAPCAAAAPPAHGSAAATDVSPQALRLAQLMAPRQLMIDAELQQFDRNFARTLLQDKEVEAAEAEFPGMVEAMAKASRPLVGKYTGDMLDRTYPQLAKLIQTDLLEPEIAELVIFYSSSEGQNILRRMVESVDKGPVYETAAKGGKISEEDVRAQQWLAAFSATGKYSDAERKALMDLSKLAAFPKLSAMQQKLRKAMIDVMNTPDPAYEKQVDEAMTAAVAEHIRAAEAVNAKK